MTDEASAVSRRAAETRVDPADRDQLPSDVLTLALGLSLWIALGSFVLAVANGLGPDPARRLAIGLLLVFVSAAALWRRDRVCVSLRIRPWLVVPLAAAQLGAAAIDGLIAGPYVAFSLTSIGLAAIAARARTVWLCVALLDVGYATAVLVDHPVAELARDGELGGAIGALVGYPVAAALFMGLRRRFLRFVAGVEQALAEIRKGAPALTPWLTRAIQGAPLALPPGPGAPPRLTPTERRVVEGLAGGIAAKELAHSWEVSLATVRTHIKHAKRKTGARTLRELVAMVAHPDWPDLSDRGA